MKSLKTYLIKSIGSGLLNSAASALSTVIILPLTIKYVGLETYGKWSLLFMFSGASNLADFGISKAVVRLLPKQTSSMEANKLLSAALIMNLSCVLFFLVLSFIATRYRILIWGNASALNPNDQQTVLVFGMLIAAISLSLSLTRGILESQYALHAVNIGFLMTTLFTYGFLFIVSIFRKNLYSLCMSTVAANIAVLIFHIISIRLMTHLSLSRPDRRSFVLLSRNSFGFFMISIPSLITLPGCRYILTSLAVNVEDIAIFDISLRIAQFAKTLLSAISTPFYTVFSQYGFAHIEKIKILVMRSISILMLCYIIGCFAFYCYGDVFLRILFTDKVEVLYMTTLLLLLGIGFHSVSEPCVRAFWALGEFCLMLVINSLFPLATFIFIPLLSSYVSPLTALSFSYSLGHVVLATVTLLVFWVKYYRSYRC